MGPSTARSGRGDTEAPSRPDRARPVRIANCSGFWGDRTEAPAELLAGPDPFDVLTGDYLAELTMYILHKSRAKDPSAGYATSFLRQMDQHLGTVLDRGIRVVVNAGGLNPRGLADALREQAAGVGLAPRVAVVTGDDITDRIARLQADGEALVNLDTGESLAESGIEVLTANAYLGGFGIAAALSADADVVVCGRVTDAALVVGPGAWWHGWGPDDLDALAGAVVAGHVIECGPQATGGNYSLWRELPTDDDRLPGFPVCELAADGSSVITKQPDTGGTVTVGTVTAQLLYEIAEPRYVNPDVVSRFDTIRVAPAGADRVAISGTVGEPAPPTLKVAVNHAGGWRNGMRMMITGLDVGEKAALAERQLWRALGGREQFARSDVRLVRSDHPDATGNAEAVATLVVEVADPERAKVGRRFSNAVSSMALSSYAGFHTLTPPGDATGFGVYWPTLVAAEAVSHTVVLPDASELVVPRPRHVQPVAPWIEPELVAGPAGRGATSLAPLGAVCGARSGDKGGNANVGVWTWDQDRFGWLCQLLTVERFRALVPDARELPVRRYALPNLLALNFVVVGLLGEGVASSTRPDPQAKGLGEYLRSRLVEVPVRFSALAD